jgi:hypothetical protein
VTAGPVPAGCSLGCAGVFLLSLLWPFLHVLGGTYEPDVLMFTFLVAPPSFILTHILALLAQRKLTYLKPRARLAVRLVWGGVLAFFILFLVGMAMRDP